MILKIILLALVINSITARSRLNSGECLKHNQALESNTGCFKLIFQDDGNFVLYQRSVSYALWSTGTHNSCTNQICMQTDGNLVAYDCHDIATWASGTMGNEGATLTLQDDGNAVLYTQDSNRAVWASGTVSICS